MIETSRVLPSNADAERIVLGSVLHVDNSLLFEAMSLLGPEDFSDDRHRRIFARMIELGSTGKPIDSTTLVHAMTVPREIESVGGVAYLLDLGSGLVRRGSIRHHAEIVKDCAKRRQLVRSCEFSADQACDRTISFDACSQAVQDALLEIEARSTATAPKHVIQFGDEVLSAIDRMRTHVGELVGLSTGIGALDSITTGIRHGEFWVLGGRPGDGKSSVALQVAMANVEQDIPVLIFSLEMSRDQVLLRMAAQLGRIPFEKIRDPRRLSDAEYGHLRGALADLGKMPLFVDDSSSLAIQQLAARARLMIRREKVKLVIVDYVQLIDADGRDERQRISKISRTLRELAKEGTPILALSQLARPKDGNLNTRPNKFSLKESGALESDAHTVLLLYRPVDQQDRPTGEDELIVAKQRHGPWSIEPVYFDTRTLSYRERQLVGRAR